MEKDVDTSGNQWQWIHFWKLMLTSTSSPTSWFPLWKHLSRQETPVLQDQQTGSEMGVASPKLCLSPLWENGRVPRWLSGGHQTDQGQGKESGESNNPTPTSPPHICRGCRRKQDQSWAVHVMDGLETQVVWSKHEWEVRQRVRGPLLRL